ncbi:MAG: hypothetical protein WCK81_04395 [Betaproteobacteria bacterium]
MATQFNDLWMQNSAWKREVALLVKLFSRWLTSHSLVDARVQQSLLALEELVKDEKVVLAVVGAGSNAKSALVSALVFSDGCDPFADGPSRVKALCTVEFGYDESLATGLHLLPTENPQQTQGPAPWRPQITGWTHFDFDVHNGPQCAQILGNTAQTVDIGSDVARDMGFQQGCSTDPPAAPETIRVPRWKHAKVNMPQTVLSNGLVVLDIPDALDAPGAVSAQAKRCLSQAHAVVFVLAADNTLSTTERRLWQDHLAPAVSGRTESWLVLTRTQSTIQQPHYPSQFSSVPVGGIDNVVQDLGFGYGQVIGIGKDEGLVAAEALVRRLVGRRQTLLHSGLRAAIQTTHESLNLLIQTRKDELARHQIELESLRGKSGAVLYAMRERIVRESAEFQSAAAELKALENAQRQSLKSVLLGLRDAPLDQEMRVLAKRLATATNRGAVTQAYAQAFATARKNIVNAHAACANLRTQWEQALGRICARNAMPPTLAPVLEPLAYLGNLELVERSHLTYLHNDAVFKLRRPEFVQKLVQALVPQLQTVHQRAANEVEHWYASAAATVEVHLNGFQAEFSNRLGALDDVQRSSEVLSHRRRDLDDQLQEIGQLCVSLERQLGYLYASAEDQAPTGRATPPTTAV